MKPAFFGLQTHSFSKNPILVIDRAGLIGERLSLKLSKEFLVVFVSRKNLDLDIENKNIIHIPFSRKFPIIPDNKYSHIIFIDEEGRDLETLPKVMGKAKDVNADFIFVQGLSSKEEYAVGKIQRLYNSAKIVLFGDIFDNKLILRKENFKSAINKFIYQAQRFGKMQILGEGLREAYPVLLNDVVDGLIDLVFGMHQSDSLFYIFPKHPPTELSLAHMIQKINPEVILDFIKHDPRLGRITYPSGGLNLLGDKYPLAKKIRGIDIKKKVGVQDEGFDGNTQKPKSFPFFIIWILMFLLFCPLVFTVLFFSLGSSTFYYAEREIGKGNFSYVRSSLHLSQTFFYVGKQASSILFFQAKILGLENNLKRFSQDLESGYRISEGLLQAFSSGAYFSKILNGKSENPTDDFIKGQNCLKSSIIALNRAKAEGKIPAPISQSLEIVNPLIKLLSNTVDIMPNILGMETPKTYLILFQNNMELRPGGGLIDSYGILKFNMGKITEFSINDVYDADRQLRGHVEPPFAIRRYLPSEHWYMRDSNFNVDFVESASSSSNFLFVETGQKADGVIGVDTSFIKSILHAIGPVYVDDYKENVDENNLHALTQFHAEKIFFSNSAQRKDFLRSLYKTIVTKLTKAKASDLLIAQAISDALVQKHLMFTFKDWQNIFTVNGWSSSLWDKRKDTRESINDFLGVNEASLGVNKASYFIKRKIAQNVKIEPDGSLFGEATLSYKNSSISWPGGNYKNYLRIILPLDASISLISINDVPQSVVDVVADFQTYEAKNFKAPAGLEVEKLIENEKIIHGFLVNIPAGELVKIKIQYIVPRKNTFDSNNFSYSLKIFKQPGIDALPYSFSLYYPDNLSVLKSEGLKKEDGSLSYSGNITGDKEMLVSFVSK